MLLNLFYYSHKVQRFDIVVCCRVHLGLKLPNFAGSVNCESENQLFYSAQTYDRFKDAQYTLFVNMIVYYVKIPNRV